MIVLAVEREDDGAIIVTVLPLHIAHRPIPPPRS